MKRIIMVLFVAILLFILAACNGSVGAEKTDAPDTQITTVSDTLPPDGGNVPSAPTLILNGEVLDVYTSHYSITEKGAQIPLTAFLESVGAEFTDSPYNAYHTQCYSLKGKKYVVADDLHLFMLEEDYRALLDELKRDGKSLSIENTADRGLLPKSKRGISTNASAIEPSSAIWTDHVSLANALKASGVDITIDCDPSLRTVTVTMP